jgi:hypothetical protein
MIRVHVPRSNIQDTLEERAGRYEVHGDYEAGSAIAVQLKDVLRAAPAYAALRPAHKQALDMIADKISRILNGDPLYADNWHDIAGYATRGEQYCLKD